MFSGNPNLKLAIVNRDSGNSNFNWHFHKSLQTDNLHVVHDYGGAMTARFDTFICARSALYSALCLKRAEFCSFSLVQNIERN